MNNSKIDFCIIVSNTLRSVAYLHNLKKNNLKPKEILYLDNKKKIKRIKNEYFDSEIRIVKFANKNSIKLSRFYSDDVDSSYFSRYLLKLKTNIFVYAGYPSKLIKNKKILKTKIILHSHSGDVKKFKGSTTIYYSLLMNKGISCSTIILNQRLDSGDVLLIKRYSLPKNILQINDVYDYYIRSVNMSLVLKKFNKYYKKREHNDKNTDIYTVIHPLLRYLTFKKFKFKKLRTS